ncbi:hypothetical protein POL68_09040 [Stigmatella sp. ncwal1]|uniref:Heme oxygenase n=1 Tax=Stigmatella ashevillensis TaxID=2995309 RepID=A0ABT5D4M0_9BACT|nr:hypothetical protein [Stigmatella ashevillena]MDC0708611.1 hypothetical protein [Stigmatella ashevillena]
MNQPQPPTGVKFPLTRVDLLLRIRQDMQVRQSGPYSYIGIPNVERVECFLTGYACGTGSLGFDPGQDRLFGDWLRDVKKDWPSQGWAEAYLQEFDGDHARALRKYVDHAAEFRALSPTELDALPWSAEERKLLGRAPSLQPMKPPLLSLDELLEIRRVGRIGLYIGYARVDRLGGYLDGYRLGLSLAGLKDEEYPRYARWLEDTGRVPIGNTWEDPFLQAARGDHEAAIHRFLDCVAEFRNLSMNP